MSTATAEPGYERLSFFDSTYLALEQANSYMHIAAIQVYEAGPLGTDAGGIDIEKIRQFVASKLHRIPRYRQRLAWIPIENFPVWVDDAHFNLDYHVKHTSLPRPGGNAELKRLAARLFARKLDRSRPLWELWVVEGLGDDRFAIVAKVHHCMIDGMAGVDLLQALLNVYPTDEMEEAVPWTPRPAPSETTLLIDEAVRLAKIPFELMRTAREVVLEGGHARADLLRKLEAARDAAKSGWFRRAGETPVNQALSPHRRFEWLSSDLDRVKYIKNQLGATVNDVVLATVAGAVRRFMTERGVDVDELEYRIMVPVSIRGDEHVGTLGNQVAMWLVELPVADTDAVDRLRIIRESIGELKGSDAALGATVLTQAGAFMPLNLLSRGVRLMWSASRPFNMTVTNVPGPQIPIYMLGSKLVAQYPMVPLYADHGIGVALFSYDGEIDWGLSADYDLVPDLDRFVIAIEDALDELHAAATKAEKKAITAEKRRATAAKKRAAAAKKSPPPKRPATAKRPAAKKAPAKKAQAES